MINEIFKCTFTLNNNLQMKLKGKQYLQIETGFSYPHNRKRNERKHKMIQSS